jgi:hypothetical protein
MQHTPKFFKEKTIFHAQRKTISGTLAYYTTKAAATVAAFYAASAATLLVEVLGSFVVTPRATYAGKIKLDHSPAIASGIIAAIIAAQSEIVEKAALQAALAFTTTPATSPKPITASADIPFIP